MMRRARRISSIAWSGRAKWRFALDCYRQAVDNRMPYLDDEYFAQAEDRFGDEANLFLPLSNDDETVNMVLVFTAYRKLK